MAKLEIKTIFAFFILLFSQVVFGDESPKKDSNWEFASDLERKNLGADGKAPPKHLDPYQLEKYHAESELMMPYDIEPQDFEAIPMGELGELKETINQMKDKIINSKANVFELSRVKSLEAKREISSKLNDQFSNVAIQHHERMSDLYELVSLSYYLDGKKVYRYAHENDFSVGSAGKLPPLKVFDGALTPGPHQLALNAIYRGRGIGVLNYLEDYRVRVTHTDKFISIAGSDSIVTVQSFEKDRVYTSFKDRPHFLMTISQIEGGNDQGSK